MTPTAFVSTYIDRVIGIVMGVLFIYFTLAMLHGYGKEAADDYKAWRPRPRPDENPIEVRFGPAVFLQT